MIPKRLSPFFFVALVAQCSLATGSQFVPLGYLSDGDSLSFATAVASDGSAACVWSSTSSAYPNKSAVWAPATGLIPLFDILKDSFSNGVSNGGLTVVGTMRPNSIEQWAMIWHPGSGYSRLPGFEDISSIASDVTPDGSIIVGGAVGEAFRWSAAEGRIGLGDLPGGYQSSSASAISDDGSVIVGTSDGAFGLEAFRWTDAEGMIGLGRLSSTDLGSSAANASADGKVIVGRVQTEQGATRAFRWTAENGMNALGTLSGYERGDSASAVSGDGSVIVGGAGGPSGSEAAFVWDQTNGMRNLQDVLATNYGLGPSLTGWTLRGASDISTDGLTIVGGGFNPDGNLEAWLVRLDYPLAVPEPTSSIAIAAFLLAAIQRIRRVRDSDRIAVS